MSLFKAFSDLNTVKIPFEENVVKVPSNEKFEIFLVFPPRNLNIQLGFLNKNAFFELLWVFNSNLTAAMLPM